MRIPSIRDRLLDNRPLLICQFLCHAIKLEIDCAQEQWKWVRICVDGWDQIDVHIAVGGLFTACERTEDGEEQTPGGMRIEGPCTQSSQSAPSPDSRDATIWHHC